MPHGSSHDANTPLPEIAGYRLLRVLNQGGMSTVYLGQQIALGREVAVKVMLPQALSDEVSRRPMPLRETLRERPRGPSASRSGASTG